MTYRVAADTSQLAEAVKNLSTLAEKASIQANAETSISESTNRDMTDIHNQLTEIQLQSKYLAATSEAANGQLKEASKHDRLSLMPAVNFLNEGKNSDRVGIYVENNGIGPARLSNFRVYLDDKLLDGTESLEWVDSDNYVKVSPNWHDTKYARLIYPKTREEMFGTQADNVEDIEKFRDLIRERIFIIMDACSVYNECESVCNHVSNSECLTYEKNLLLRQKTPKITRLQ
jgi:hypothetical protein